MEAIKQELVEAGVIGRVVDDFNSHIKMDIFYGDKRISLGEELSLSEARCRPYRIEYNFDPDRPELEELFKNQAVTTLIMTDPDAPNGEYLHWLATYFFTTIGEASSAFRQELVAYERPRSMDTRMIVFTAFRSNEAPNYVPNSRENFSTRVFANTNRLGPPLAAAFFKIKDEEEEAAAQSDVEDPEDPPM